MRNSALRLLQRLGAAGAKAQWAPAAAVECAAQAQPRQLPAASFALSQALQQRSIATSSAVRAEAATVDGAEAILSEIDRVVSNENASAKEVADAAVSLAYLQAKGSRRLWGKVFERAAASKASFDAASLSAFLWASNTAGVAHFKTVFELAGPAASLLKSFTPAQLSVVVEALGQAGVKDLELLGAVSDLVVANVGSFKGAELARVLCGFAAAGVEDGKLAAAVSKALADKAGELSAREASQAVWGLAKLKRADKATVDALVKAAKGKLAAGESGVDAAALAWSLGYLGYKPEGDALKVIADAVKAAAPELTATHAVDAAWGLAVLGGSKDAVSALTAVAASAIDAAPDALEITQVAALFEAATLAGVKLPEKVGAFSAKMYALASEASAANASSALKGFKASVAEATARGMGARYRPEVTAALQGFKQTTPEGIAVEVVVPLDANTKVAVEAVCKIYLSSAGTPLGPALARARLLESLGYKVAAIPAPEYSALPDIKAKASYVLAKIKAAVPSASSKVDSLQKQLDAPFDAYAD